VAAGITFPLDDYSIAHFKKIVNRHFIQKRESFIKLSLPCPILEKSVNPSSCFRKGHH
jgi:hypothetical protein